MALFLGTKNTVIEFVHCDFSLNGSPFVVGGAGLGVITDFRRPANEKATPPHVAHNRNTSLRVQDSKFIQNVALYGAGIFYDSVYRSAVSDLTDVIYFFIQNSTFQENMAFTGSAILAWEFKSHAAYVGTQLQVTGVNIIGNIISSTNSAQTISSTNSAQTNQQQTGIIDLRTINMTLKGSCSISNNAGTGLKAEASYVGIDGNVTFSENTGVRGGAMFLFSFSYLIVLPNASLYLLNNKAREAGGAIYTNLLRF